MSTVYVGSDTFHGSGITIPSDGDQRNVLSVNPAFEALEDDVTFLHNRLGVYFQTTGSIFNLSPLGPFTGTTYPDSPTTLASFAGLHVLDEVDLAISGNISVTTAAAAACRVGLFGKQGAAATVNLNESIVAAAGNVAEVPFCITCRVQITTAGTFVVTFDGRVTTGGDSVITTSLTGWAKVWRQS